MSDHHEPIDPRENQSGIFHEKDRENLKRRIASELERMRWSLRDEDREKLLAILSRERGNLGAREGLEDLKNQLMAARERSEISEETLSSVMRLLTDARSLLEREMLLQLTDLKREVSPLNRSDAFTVKNGVYASETLSWIRRLDSRLGENVLKDMAGLAVGLTDSAWEVFRSVVLLLVDVLRSPIDIVTMMRKQSK